MSGTCSSFRKDFYELVRFRIGAVPNLQFRRVIYFMPFLFYIRILFVVKARIFLLAIFYMCPLNIFNRLFTAVECLKGTTEMHYNKRNQRVHKSHCTLL